MHGRGVTMCNNGFSYCILVRNFTSMSSTVLVKRHYCRSHEPSVKKNEYDVLAICVVRLTSIGNTFVPPSLSLRVKNTGKAFHQSRH